MAALEDFAGAGVTATRTAATQTISITGGLLQVTGYLDAGTVPPGWRVDCSSGGGLAFNVADAVATEFSISSRTGSSILLSSVPSNLIDGDAVEKDGDLGDLENATVYYVEKGSANTVYLHATRAEALAGLTATRISAGTGAVPGTDGGFSLAAGRRDIGTIGDLDGPEVQIIERADAHAFRGDNFSNASEVARFQAGKVTLRNFYWESLRPNGSGDANRSDFDIANGAEPVFERGEIATLAQYNHFASSLLQVKGLRFRNRTAGANSSALEFARPFATPPEGLSILPAGRGLRVLAADLADAVPAKFRDLDTGYFDIFPNGISESAANAKVVWLVDPAGTPTKGRTTGLVEVRRAVELDFGTEASGTGGSCRLVPTDQNPPYTLDTVHADATGPHLFPEVLHRRAAGGTSTYTDWGNYRWIKVSPSYRKATGTFEVAAQTEAGQTQRITATLVREAWPNGTNYSHAAVAACASVDDVYRAVKAHELANPHDPSAFYSFAVINADGYIEMGAGISLVLSSSATELTAWDGVTQTLTVKASATVAASSNGVLGIEVTGDGTITTEGTVDISAWLSKTATAQNSRVVVEVADANVKVTLFASDGTQIGTHTSTEQNIAILERASSRITLSQSDYDALTIGDRLVKNGSLGESVDGQTYYVKIKLNRNQIRISASPGGAVINLGTGDIPAGDGGFTLEHKTATFRATAAQSTAGCRLLASRAGHEPQTRTLDLSAGGSFSETFGSLREVTQFDGTASYAADRVSSVSTVTFNVSSLSNVRATIEVANETLGVLEAFSTFASKAQTTVGGQKYLAFGGTLPIAVSAFTGDILALPASVNIKRRHTGDVNATVGATVTAPAGATIVDESNGAVQMVGGVQLADFQRAIFADWDLDPTEAGTQSLGAKLLSIGTIASANATAIAALPSSATIVDAVLGASVETGGDTVKAALARTADIPTTAAPSAATIRDGVLGAEVASGGDTAKEALARLASLPTTAAPTAAAVRDAILGASVANGGDTVKQALARLAGLPSSADVATAVMGFTIVGDHDLATTAKVALAVLGGTGTVSGSTVTYSVGETEVVSATVEASGARSSVVIAD